MVARPVLVTFAAGGALALSVLAAPVAHAAPMAHAAAPVTCTITGTSPDVVTVGVGPQQVQFGVHTDCDGHYPVSWDLDSDIYPGSSGASWLLLRNYHHPSGEKFTHVENAQGFFTVDFTTPAVFSGNKMAGRHPLGADAFYDANGNGLSDDPLSTFGGSFIAKRATTFGDSFSAGPGVRRPGQRISITASLARANWDTAQNEPFGACLELQFRPAGSSRFRDVKPVEDDGTSATTTVRAETTGAWRYHYAGDDFSGAVDSPAVTVVVMRNR
jgi:hypothetical protein